MARKQEKLYDSGELAVWLAETPTHQWVLLINYGDNLIELPLDTILDKIAQKEKEADDELADTVFSDTD